jgi:hypothetical protein
MLCDEILSSIQSVCSFIPLLYDAISTVGHAMTQSPASHRRARGQYCGICCEQSVAESFISQFCFPLSVSFHRGFPYPCIIWGWKTVLMVAAIQRHCLIPSVWIYRPISTAEVERVTIEWLWILSGDDMLQETVTTLFLERNAENPWKYQSG